MEIDDGILNNVQDSRDIEVLFLRIGEAWKTNKSAVALSKEFDYPLRTVEEAVKYHNWLYS
jgi:hypothetical protein